MALKTRFTELVGCQVPLQLAAMPGVGTPELIAAVAGAGGLAMLGMPMAPAAVVVAMLDRLKAAGVDLMGFNQIAHFPDREAVVAAASRVRVVELFYGEPDAAVIRDIHQGGALACWQAGSVREALAAEAAGCDLVVAQGTEAGGHVRGQVSLLPLLGQVLEAVKVPVIAAGGIGGPREMAAALAAGADAVRVGTRFVAARESAAHPLYVEALLRAAPEDTTLTETFSTNWPDAPHRVLRACIEAARALPDSIIGERTTPAGPMPLPRFGTSMPTTATSGHIEAMAHYAGESVGQVRAVEPAAAIVRQLVEGAEALLRRWDSAPDPRILTPRT
jgi:NAD(P)H-dependent flavin oxidoreductase YrpB (nitropropane dioxygenase family)